MQRIKLGITIQEYAKELGVSRTNAGTRVFGSRNALFLSIYSLFFILSNAYRVHTANNLREYAMCFFVWLTLLVLIIGCIILVGRSQIFFHLLDSMEATINKGEQKNQVICD